MTKLGSILSPNTQGDGHVGRAASIPLVSPLPSRKLAKSRPAPLKLSPERSQAKLPRIWSTAEFPEKPSKKAKRSRSESAQASFISTPADLPTSFEWVYKQPPNYHEMRRSSTDDSMLNREAGKNTLDSYLPAVPAPDHLVPPRPKFSLGASKLSSVDRLASPIHLNTPLPAASSRTPAWISSPDCSPLPQSVNSRINVIPTPVLIPVASSNQDRIEFRVNSEEELKNFSFEIVEEKRTDQNGSSYTSFVLKMKHPGVSDVMKTPEFPSLPSGHIPCFPPTPKSIERKADQSPVVPGARNLNHLNNRKKDSYLALAEEYRQRMSLQEDEERDESDSKNHTISLKGLRSPRSPKSPQRYGRYVGSYQKKDVSTTDEEREAAHSQAFQRLVANSNRISWDGYTKVLGASFGQSEDDIPATDRSRNDSVASEATVVNDCSYPCQGNLRRRIEKYRDESSVYKSVTISNSEESIPQLKSHWSETDTEEDADESSELDLDHLNDISFVSDSL